jgi:DNA-binding NtrC family response regulator
VQGVTNVAVFVVDDDPLICSLVAKVLTRAGLEVRTYADADTALAALEANGPIEMLLTDVSMPGRIDGIGLAGRVAAKYPKTPIVLMSGDEESLARGRDISAVTATLAKPFTIRELDDLDQALGCRGHGSGKI